jgi:6-phosphogluconolactonase
MMKIRYSRREFVVGAGAVPFALRAVGEAQAASGTRWVLLGTDAGRGIYRAAWNATTGTLGPVELAVETRRPTFLARHPSLPVVYSVNEENGPAAGVSSFRLERRGALTLLNEVGSQGDGPCFVSTDATGQMAFVADYAGGAFVAFRLTNVGTLAQAIGVFKYAQATHGPVAARQEAAHIHCATVAPGNRHVVACDLGDDVLLVFPIGPEQGGSVRVPQRVMARAGSGPRHVAFHPAGSWMYCIHELDCTIDLYEWRMQGGTPTVRLREDSVVSTLARGAARGDNTASEIVVSDDGQFVYAATRGVGEIAVYRVEPSTGLLREQQRVRCGGTMPRHIALDPSRRWLVCCNQEPPGVVAVFSHDAATGRLSEKPRRFAAPTPMFALWV